MSDQGAFDSRPSVDGPRSLAYCVYPRAKAQPYRSRQHSTVVAAHLTPNRVLEMARVVGGSFARREPQTRHLRPPKLPPAGLMQARHNDPFGDTSFGPWTTETLRYWFIRLLVLTDPTSPSYAVRVNEETLAQSLAIVDQTGRITGGALNETMPPPRRAARVPPERSISRRRPVVHGADSHHAEYPGCGGAHGAVRPLPGVS